MISKIEIKGSGFISADELREVLARMGRRYTREQVDVMISSIDKDGNGQISINEFMTLL